MTGCTMRSSTPPLALISSIASNVAFNWDCSTAEVTPVWENSTPTRHGASVFSLKLITLTWTISSQDGSDLTPDCGKLKSPCRSPVPFPTHISDSLAPRAGNLLANEIISAAQNDERLLAQHEISDLHHPQPAMRLERAGIVRVDEQDGFPARQQSCGMCNHRLEHTETTRGLIDADRTIDISIGAAR